MFNMLYTNNQILYSIVYLYTKIHSQNGPVMYGSVAYAHICAYATCINSSNLRSWLPSGKLT